MKYLFIILTLINFNLSTSEPFKSFSNKKNLGNHLYNVLGKYAFSNKEEATGAGWSFNENNRFHKGEIIIYEKLNNEFVYGIVDKINQNQIHINFGYGYLGGCLICLNTYINTNLVGLESIGKFQEQ